MKTAEHLGMKWYAMFKFCETRLAQSELMVYKIFEKIYIAPIEGHTLVLSFPTYTVLMRYV